MNSPGKKTLVAVAMAASLTLSSCADMSQTEKDTTTDTGIAEKDTTTDTGIGAKIGAFFGGIFGDGKNDAVKGATNGAVAGAAGGYIWSKNMQEQKKEMEQATKGTGIEVSKTADNQLKLQIPSDVSFDVGKADIKPKMRPVLDKFAQSLNTYPETTVRIVGHTDSTGGDAINDPLSVKRAASARAYIVRHGVEGDRVAINGRGSHEPIADNGTAQGRARNRRVDIFVGEPAPANQQSSL